jgi:hypothetical protein
MGRLVSGCRVSAPTRHGSRVGTRRPLDAGGRASALSARHPRQGWHVGILFLIPTALCTRMSSLFRVVCGIRTPAKGADGGCFPPAALRLPYDTAPHAAHHDEPSGSVAGDFFTAVPAGYDAYMIKSVLHDWDDDKAVQILRLCRDVMPSHGRVLVIEIVVYPGKPMGHPHPMIDLEMMVTLGGKERTEQEFATLLNSAGLTLEQVTPINGSFFSVIEATPA